MLPYSFWLMAHKEHFRGPPQQDLNSCHSQECTQRSKIESDLGRLPLPRLSIPLYDMITTLNKP